MFSDFFQSSDQALNAPAAVARVVWSTDTVQPAKRLHAWQSVIKRSFGECDMDYQTDGDFWAAINYSRFGNIGIGRISGSKRKVIRGDAQAKSSSDGVTLSIACAGKFQYSQAGRDHLLETGGGHFFHNCLPGVIESNEGSEYWLVSLPAAVIVPRLGDSSSLIGHRICQTKAELRLLGAYLTAVHQIAGLRDANTRSIIGDQVTDLVVSALGQEREDTGPSTGRGVRAGRYRLAIKEIAQRYTEPMLNGERIAKALGVSERYVQQLFEENGVTISTYIQDERLKAARCQLADRSQDYRTVTDIAYACGFSDVSHFNRCFRRKYGETPMAVRKFI